MPGIAAIQHPLGDIDSGPRYVGFVVDIGDWIDRATVNSHPQLNVRVILQASADLERTANRLLEAVKKEERHPVTCRNSNKFTICFGRLETFRCAHNSIQLLQQLNLFIYK